MDMDLVIRFMVLDLPLDGTWNSVKLNESNDMRSVIMTNVRNTLNVSKGAQIPI